MHARNISGGSFVRNPGNVGMGIFLRDRLKPEGGPCVRGVWIKLFAEIQSISMEIVRYDDDYYETQ